MMKLEKLVRDMTAHSDLDATLTPEQKRWIVPYLKRLAPAIHRKMRDEVSEERRKNETVDR